MLAIEFAMPMSRRYYFDIANPEGYEVEEVPKEISYVLPSGGGEYTCRVQVTENTIQILVRFRINRLLFSPNEYPLIREMFNLILAKRKRRSS